MVFTDQTPLFQSLLHPSSSSSALPSPSSSSSSPLYPPTRSKSPIPNPNSVASSRSSSRSRTRSRRRVAPGGDGDEGGEEFLREAYRIHHHLSSLSSLLLTIRKPYLSLSAPPPRRRHSTSINDADQGQEQNSLKRWEKSTWLSDREREEIDLRGRMILRRCRDWVVVLEGVEKVYSKRYPLLTALVRQTKTSPQSTILTLLPSLRPSQSPFSPLVSAHRASILWTLNDLLSRTTTELSNLQEERAKRRSERSRTLGDGAAGEAARMKAVGEMNRAAGGAGSGVSAVAGMLGWGIGDASNGVSSSNGSSLPIQTQPVVDPGLASLTPAQLQIFESENSALLQHMESTLTSVLAAERSLLEVSALQTELVRNLMQQTEITDRLYDEAVGSVGDVGKANEQLKKAKERGEEGRLFLVVFLVGASLALLFLDWYS